MTNITMTVNRNTEKENCKRGLAASPKVNLDMLQEYWQSLRCSGPDLFRVVKYFDASKVCVELQRGWLPKGDENPERIETLVDRSKSLSSFVQEQAAEASKKISNPFDFYEAERNGFYALFAQSMNGVVGVAWSNDGDMIKAKMMAAFALYCLGLKCAGSDIVLWEACYRHLPYRSRIDLQMADKLFASYLTIGC